MFDIFLLGILTLSLSLKGEGDLTGGIRAHLRQSVPAAPAIINENKAGRVSVESFYIIRGDMLHRIEFPQ